MPLNPVSESVLKAFDFEEKPLIPGQNQGFWKSVVEVR
jgi:hypothetical protein